ncbi:hypothetical protein LVJ94_48920 [Pendulispora rubella]|uniref:Uncharacterized protein n=1 Tax=Pendulispora rubella TaxID=2741070 RepID=A0ABZ2L1X3_9BACT
MKRRRWWEKIFWLAGQYRLASVVRGGNNETAAFVLVYLSSAEVTAGIEPWGASPSLKGRELLEAVRTASSKRRPPLAS